MVVKWEHFHETHPPHQGDGVPQDEEEDDDCVEVQAEPIGPCEHEEVVWLRAIALVPIPLRIEMIFMHNFYIFLQDSKFEGLTCS